MRNHFTAALLFFPLFAACGADLAIISDEEDESASVEAELCSPNDVDGLTENSREALGVLRVANQLDLATLRSGVRLTKTAARNLVSRRDGPDAARGTADDRPFASLRDLSSVCNVGSSAIHSLLLWAMAHGEVSPADAGVAVVDAGVAQPDPFSPCTGPLRLPTTDDLVFQYGSKTTYTRTCDSFGVCSSWTKQGNSQPVTASNGPRSLFITTSGGLYLQAQVGPLTSSQSGSSTYLCRALDFGSGSVDPVTGQGIGRMRSGYRCNIAGGSGGPYGDDGERLVDIRAGSTCVSLTDQVSTLNAGVQRRNVIVLPF